MIKYLKNIISFGVKPSDDFYYVRLKRAINILALNAIVCIVVAVLLGIFVSKDLSTILILLAIPFYVLVIVLNSFDKAHIGISLLFGVSSTLLVIYSLRTGEDALTHMLFILNIIGLAVLYRKGKIRTYYFINLAVTLLCLGFVLVSFENNWFQSFQDPMENAAYSRKVNLSFLVACSILFSIVVVSSFSQQFKRLKKSVDDKDVLLAELNHRVKNNLSIIVSLLRLKEDLSKEKETKEALRDIGNRIHSMALVHRRMYSGEGKSYVYVPDYIDDLMDGICQSLGEHPDITCEKNIDNISLDVSKAIPVGMIFNELIMNSLKHAFESIDKPEIIIDYHRGEGGDTTLTYKDNGVGMDESILDKAESLGLDLIHSLTEQLDGTCAYKNGRGLTFEMQFPG